MPTVWNGFFIIGNQEVFFLTKLIPSTKSFGYFPAICPACSPPLESLLQQRARKRSGFFNCQFNLPPSATESESSQRSAARLSGAQHCFPSNSRQRNKFTHRKAQDRGGRGEWRRKLEGVRLLQPPVSELSPLRVH